MKCWRRPLRRTGSARASKADHHRCVSRHYQRRKAALDKLRRTIRTIVPRAEECISYAIPAFRLNGKVVAGFAATAKGCSYFPFSGSTLATLADELESYDMTKSSLHFDPAKPLPMALVRKLIKARIAET